jgi:hypothetical protein
MMVGRDVREGGELQNVEKRKRESVCVREREREVNGFS